MPSQRFVTLTREGTYCLIILGFVLAGALIRQINLLVVLFGMLTSAMLLSYRLVKFTLKKVDLHRQLPEAIVAGETFTVTLVAENKRRRVPSWAITVRDTVVRVGDTAAAVEPVLRFAYLPPHRKEREVVAIRLMQRGQYRFGPLRVSTRFPFGLLKASLVDEQRSELLVVPRVGRLGRAWQQRLATVDIGGGSSRRQQNAIDGDFYGLREWRSTDSRSWIHWRTSARRQSLMVRQYEQPRQSDLALVLDLWQPTAPNRRQIENVELAISFAATIITDSCRRGGAGLTLATEVGHAPVRGQAGSALAEAAMRALALLNPSISDTLAAQLAQVLRTARSTARVIVISTRAIELTNTERFGLLWNDAMLSSALGRVSVVNVDDPTFMEWFQVV